MLSRVLSFLRPSFFGLVGFALILGMANLARRSEEEPDLGSPPGDSGNDLAGVDLQGVVLPKPELEPREVVRLQLSGLANRKADGVGILQCYCFASPGNRAVTGPLDRFGQLVRQGPFHSMADPRALLVGRPEYHDGLARLLVTVIDDKSQIHAFTFFLRRQVERPFTDCWMTEAVLPAWPMPENDSAPAPDA